MDSDSDCPFNYSWPSFPKMRMRRKMAKKGNFCHMRGNPSLPGTAVTCNTLIHTDPGELQTLYVFNLLSLREMLMLLGLQCELPPWQTCLTFTVEQSS